MKTEQNMKLSAYENFLSGIKKKKDTLEEYTGKLNVYQKSFKTESCDIYIQKGSNAIHEDVEFYINMQQKMNLKNNPGYYFLTGIELQYLKKSYPKNYQKTTKRHDKNNSTKKT